MIRCLMLSILLAAGGSSAAGQANKAADQPKKKTSEAWYYKLARILGVDRAPVALKGPSSARPGELWIAPIDRIDPRRLTEGSDFTSPVFQPGGRYVFALRQAQLVCVPARGGPPAVVRNLPRVIKLVGFDGGHPDKVLALFQSEEAANSRAVDVALLSVNTGKVQMVAKGQPADSEAAEALLGWQRHYGKITVRPQAGQIVVTGVESVETPVTDCGDAFCGEPAYSPELRQVAFIRSPR